MITLAFVKLCMNTLLGSTNVMVLADSETGYIQKFGTISALANVENGTTSVTWKTNTAQYFNEGDSTPTTVSRINVGAKTDNGFDSYYSMPLQSAVSIGEGNQIKVNPYAESGGVHTRGIKVTFSIPE